ncbi:MAG: ferredoxin--NADP reductase, partial [Pseudomonadota bacterium]
SLDDGTETPHGALKLRVVAVSHHSDSLFHFQLERDPGFRFRSGEFAMLGLPLGGVPFRAYSIASAVWDDTLSFYSVKVPNGPLTSQLQYLRPGDSVLLKRKTTGSLVCDNLRPGTRLVLLSTGTGVAPFASLVLDPAVYDQFESVVLVHGCRTEADLRFAHELEARIRDDRLVDSVVQGRFRLVTTTTRELGHPSRRITDLLYDGSWHRGLAQPALDSRVDRVMICGSRAMLKDTRLHIEALGFDEGTRTRPGSYVVERAFVD